jgi:hypothetical protein
LAGAIAYFLSHAIGGTFGVLVLALVAATYLAIIFKLSRRSVVNASNVNDALGESLEDASREPVLAA